MSLSVDQKVRLLARQVQRFHEYSAGTGRPNSKIIKAPDVKLAAALEPVFELYGPPAPQHTGLEREAMWVKTGNETWPRVNEEPKPQVAGFESRDRYTQEYQSSQNLVDLSEDGNLITLAHRCRAHQQSALRL
ncbi:hypothetical protein FDENT_11887 [Fusarium denticulatum]|uniref:Uncharacterized protein n=1 Tax=Fusarium denticulatum TaxID=48507 RepID=A0A8H5TEI6_9HYPO|nr:hypothetical protein FDENT_11887 [Fusarium denticulatum]